MKNEICKLFVYGSLRSGFQHQAYQYLSQYFHLLGDAVVKGKLFDKGDFPVAIATTEEKFITGELYELNTPGEFSWAIGQLDDYEGLNVEEGETALYKREAVIVYHNNQQCIAWIYWYNGNPEGLPLIASGDVLQYLKDKANP
jgi:gamma-glutamylcyclotransferase (GGCT)/AIG2-like uncharacterized protein YtfP